jgi:hypothetical protein
MAKNNPARGRFRRVGRGVIKIPMLPHVGENIPSVPFLSTVDFPLWQNEPRNAFPRIHVSSHFLNLQSARTPAAVDQLKK